MRLERCAGGVRLRTGAGQHLRLPHVRGGRVAADVLVDSPVLRRGREAAIECTVARARARLQKRRGGRRVRSSHAGVVGRGRARRRRVRACTLRPEWRASQRTARRPASSAAAPATRTAPWPAPAPAPAPAPGRPAGGVAGCADRRGGEGRTRRTAPLHMCCTATGPGAPALGCACTGCDCTWQFQPAPAGRATARKPRTPPTAAAAAAAAAAGVAAGAAAIGPGAIENDFAFDHLRRSHRLGRAALWRGELSARRAEAGSDARRLQQCQPTRRRSQPRSGERRVREKVSAERLLLAARPTRCQWRTPALSAPALVFFAIAGAELYASSTPTRRFDRGGGRAGAGCRRRGPRQCPQRRRWRRGRARPCTRRAVAERASASARADASRPTRRLRVRLRLLLRGLPVID